MNNPIIYLALLVVGGANEALGSLSQSNTIRSSDFVENFTLPFGTPFMCSVYSQFMGFTSYWVDYATGTCSVGEIKSHWAHDPNGINVFVETTSINGKELFQMLVHYVGGTDDRGDEVPRRDRVPEVVGCHT